MPPNRYFRVKQRKPSEMNISVREAVLDFLASTDVRGKQPSTIREYEHNLLKFAEWCGENSLSQNKKDQTWSVVAVREHHDPIWLHRVNDQVVHLFLEHLKETAKPARNDHEELSSWTFRNYVKCIKRFLNWCLLDEQYSEHTKAIVVQRIATPKVEQEIIEIFSPDDLEALFAACKKEDSLHLQVRNLAILYLLIDSGIRATELCTLLIGNVDLSRDDPHIKVFGKGRKWREVGIGEQTRRVIQQYIREFREPTIELAIADQIKNLPTREANIRKRELMGKERVLVGRASDPLGRTGLLQIIYRLAERAGIEGVRCSPHTFRHTFAVLFMVNGGDIYKLSKILGHTSVKTTENYLRWLMQSQVRKGTKSVLDSFRSIVDKLR